MTKVPAASKPSNPSQLRYVLTIALLGVCAGSGCTGDEASTFTGEELTLLNSDTFGVLGDRAPAERTNKYADNVAAQELGQKLFFEEAYSVNGEISCATCHKPEHGWADPDASGSSEGVPDRFTDRNSPTVVNAGVGAGVDGETNWMDWAGRKDSLWSQAVAPPESPVEMGGTRTKVVLVIQEHYKDEYETIFGDFGPELTAPDTAMPGPDSQSNGWDDLSETQRKQINRIYVNFAKAIGAYQRLIISRDSKFDKFLAEIKVGATDSDELSASEKLGLQVFMGKGKCVTCHSGPNLTDWSFHNSAVAQEGDHAKEQDRGRSGAIATLLADPFNCASEYSDHPDKSACAVSRDLEVVDSNLGAFKTPSLREISKTGPYMHTGSMATLAEVIAHYNKGGHRSGFVGIAATDVQPLGLLDMEMAALEDFLRALDGAPLPADLTSKPE